MAEQEKNYQAELLQAISDVKAVLASRDAAVNDEQKLYKTVEDILAKRPVRAGETVGPVGSVGTDVIADGKWEGCKARHIVMAAYILQRAHKLDPKKHKAPSNELVQKAMTATGALTGDELVLHGMDTKLWEDIFLASNVVSNIPGRIAMPTDPFTLPIGLGDVTWYKGVSMTATTASTPATAKSTMTATEQIAEVDFEYDLEEDAIIAIMPALENRIKQSAAEQIDAFVLNADGTDANNINSHDNANATDTKWYLSKGEDGLRHMFLVDNSAMCVNAGGDALADADVLGAFTLMGKYIVKPRDSFMIVDVATYFKGFQDLSGVQTIADYGPGAVLLTGELAAYRGVPIVISSSMLKTAADGMVDDDTALRTLGQIAIVNRNSWMVGFKRELLLEVDRDVLKRGIYLVASFRIAVASYGGATKTALTHTAGIRNIAVA